MDTEATPPYRLDEVSEAIAAIAAGGIVVVADDEDRENEGDLIMAADAPPQRPSASSCGTPPV